MPATLNSRVPGMGTPSGTTAPPCVTTTWLVLSLYKVSAMTRVMVGFATEKVENPSAEKLVTGRVKLTGGDALPKPFAAFAGNTWTVPTPEMESRRAPYVHVAVVPPMVPLNDVAAPTGDVPATVMTPAPLTQ